MCRSTLVQLFIFRGFVTTVREQQPSFRLFWKLFKVSASEKAVWWTWVGKGHFQHRPVNLGCNELGVSSFIFSKDCKKCNMHSLKLHRLWFLRWSLWASVCFIILIDFFSLKRFHLNRNCLFFLNEWLVIEINSIQLVQMKPGCIQI